MDVNIRYNLPAILMLRGAVPKTVDKAIEAALFIVEDAYVEEAPGDKGDFKQGIRPRKDAVMDYIVESTAESNGANYPFFLYMGTGRLKGQPDYGYTTGHVRAGTVAYGIGGIRPNKAADRAKKKSQKPFMNKLNQLIKMAIENDRATGTR